VKRLLVAIAITWCGTRNARADEPSATLGGSASMGALTNLWVMGLLALEVSWRSPAPDWRFRGEAGTGITSAIDEGHGHVYELRAGIEHVRRCCFYYGVDLALVRGELYDNGEDWQMTGVFAIPRAGLDIHVDRFGFRLGAELPLGVGPVHYTGFGETNAVELISGFSVTAALEIVVD
jgi:hypothetical protein